MAGTLLSGWRIRLFDANGTPLYPGRVNFYDSSTSLPKTVYADNDLTVALGTSVPTDIEGYLPAIWLDAGYYKADVQQRIQADPETWGTLWNINNVGKALAQTGVPGSGILAYCENIAELKAIEAGTIDAAIVAGYYNAGDCGEPLFFTWDPSATRADDGGAYIRSNDTPPMSAGRYVQNIKDEILDIRKWGGIPDSPTIDCTGPLVQMQNYAGFYQHYKVPPRIGFKAPGEYYFSGDVTLNATHYTPQYDHSEKIPYYIGNSVEFTNMTTGITLTIANPTIIETDEPICQSPNSLKIEPGTMEYTRPQWISDRAGGIDNKISQCLAFDLPCRVYGKYAEGECEVKWQVEWNGTKPVIIESPSLYFVSPDSNPLTINCPLQILHDSYVFRMSNVLITSNVEVNAAWFGWGSVQGDNGAFLNAAIKANNGQSAVVIPYKAGAKIGTTVNGTAGMGYTNIIKPLGTLEFTGSAGMSGVYLDAADNMFAIAVPGDTNKITLLNSYVSPYWFGALPGSGYNPNGNAPSLEAAIYCSMRSNCHLDGLGKHFSIHRGLVLVGGGTSGGGTVCRMKNIFINPTSNYNVGTSPWLITISGGIDVELEYVSINENIVAGISSLYCTAFWQRINKCFFGNDVYIRGEDVVFSGNQIFGETTGSNFYSATRGCIVSNNTFTHCRVHLQGDPAIKAGRVYSMLEGIIFTGNTLNNIDEQFYNGCLYLIATAPNTLVSGLVITNNVFGGNIPMYDASGNYIDDSYRMRIDDRLGEGASWAQANVPNNGGVQHLMVITDNTYQRLKPYMTNQAAPIPGHADNFVPGTRRVLQTYSRSLTGTQSQMNNSIIMESFSISMDRRDMFRLTGDTNSIYTNLIAGVKGWRRKTGEHTWDTFRCVNADVAVLAATGDLSTVNVTLGINKYQWGATSNGWAGSTVSFWVEASIYEG